MKCLKIRHSGITVNNLENSILDYETLGFRVAETSVEKWPAKRGHHTFHIAKLEAADGSRIELIQGPSRAHICIEVDEIPASWPIAKQAEDHMVTFTKDRDGNRIELYQRKEKKENDI